MTNDLDDKPVTLAQLKAVLAEFRVDFKTELKAELKAELKVDMVSLLARFYNDMIEPRFKVIDERFDRVDAKLDDHDQRFDDLYKKVEDLRQEYIVSNEHIRRLEKKISGLVH